MDGFIKIDRKLLDWDYADNLALTGFWIHLLLKAQWEDTKKLKRGEFYTTYEILASECNIHRSTVAKYLNMLRATGQIKTTTDHRRTKIRIMKWDEYQSSFKTTTATTTAYTTATTTAKTTYPYIKNIRNKEIKKSEAQPPTLAEVKSFIKSEHLSVHAERFFYYYEEKKWHGVNDWQTKLRSWDAIDRQKNRDLLPEYITDPESIQSQDDDVTAEEIADIMNQL